jgi:hypothetical protein
MMARALEMARPPSLDLSGPVLRDALARLAADAEAEGGIEAYRGWLGLKAQAFAGMLEGGNIGALDAGTFLDLCSFMAPARRRVGRWLAAHGYAIMQARLTQLLAGGPDLARADAVIGAFAAAFAAEGASGWPRDLAAEVLHFSAPDVVPLMTRWVWDAGTRTGVLREIWHDVEALPDGPAVADDAATFAVLRDELFGFLQDNGVFRDRALMVDLLCAHIYAGYIERCGGTFLKTQFGAGRDPMAHTRRLLGLDAALGRAARSAA